MAMASVLGMLAFLSSSAMRAVAFHSNAALMRRGRHSHSMIASQRQNHGTRRGAAAAKESLDGASLFHSLDSVQRVFCISDLHTDHPDNLLWLADQCRRGGLLREDDLVVVAGDISHDIPTFRAALQIIRRATCHVLFVPGNHEAWLSTLPRHRSGDATFEQSLSTDEPQDSLEKLEQIYNVCHDMGVWTETLLVGAATQHPLWVVPLQSWYDGSLSLEGCEDLCRDFNRWPWVDFQRCQWPAPFLPEPPTSDNPRIPMGLNDMFLQRNQDNLEFVARQIRSSSHRAPPTSVMTVSHFLPNQQCLPDWKDVNAPRFLRSEWLDHGAPEISAKFAKVAGSLSIDEQLRTTFHKDNDYEHPLRRHIHVFGHSHRPKDFDYKGIRYIHNPLGKPRERQLHMVNPQVNFQLVWDTTQSGEVPAKTPVIRYWEEQGGGKDALRRRMAQPFTRVASTATSSTALLQEQVLRVSYSNSTTSQRLGLFNTTSTATVTTKPSPAATSTTTTPFESPPSSVSPTKASSRLAVLVSENSTRTDVVPADET